MGRESAPRGASVTMPVPAGSADFLASTNQTAQGYANSLGVTIKVFGATQVVAPTAYAGIRCLGQRDVTTKSTTAIAR